MSLVYSRDSKNNVLPIQKFYNLNFSSKKLLVKDLKSLLGFTPKNLFLYEEALTHHSIQKKHPLDNLKVIDNERLEFLGDAVLDCIIAEKLYLKFPLRGEGFLTEMRSKIVSRDELAKLSKKMGIKSLLFYDKGLEKNPQFTKTMEGNAIEAIIGAIYLDRGYTFTRKFINHRILDSFFDMDAIEQRELSYKSRINRWAQKNKTEFKTVTLEEFYQGRNKIYKIAVIIDDKEISTGENMSKKKAEEFACEKACGILTI